MVCKYSEVPCEEIKRRSAPRLLPESAFLALSHNSSFGSLEVFVKKKMPLVSFFCIDFPGLEQLLFRL